MMMNYDEEDVKMVYLLLVTGLFYEIFSMLYFEIFLKESKGVQDFCRFGKILNRDQPLYHKLYFEAARPSSLIL